MTLLSLQSIKMKLKFKSLGKDINYASHKRLYRLSLEKLHKYFNSQNFARPKVTKTPEALWPFKKTRPQVLQQYVFGPRRDEVTGEWRRLHNEELNDLYSSSNIVRVIKSRRMRWAGHVARMGERRGV